MLHVGLRIIPLHINQRNKVICDVYVKTCGLSLFVSGNPTRNEKYLAALATGKWVLHKSYLEACRVEKGFVEVSSFPHINSSIDLS